MRDNALSEGISKELLGRNTALAGQRQVCLPGETARLKFGTPNADCIRRAAANGAAFRRIRICVCGKRWGTSPGALSVTQWERVMKAPALVWLNPFSRCGGGRGRMVTPWAAATGQWVHKWLARIARRPIRRPPNASRRLRNECARKRFAFAHKTEALCVSKWKNSTRLVDFRLAKRALPGSFTGRQNCHH